MRWTECAVVVLRPTAKNGYLRETDLTPDTFSALGWSAQTRRDDRRAVLDLRYVTGFGAGTAERVARFLIDSGVGVVQVEGTHRPGMRSAFAAQVAEAASRYERRPTP